MLIVYVLFQISLFISRTYLEVGLGRKTAGGGKDADAHDGGAWWEGCGDEELRLDSPVGVKEEAGMGYAQLTSALCTHTEQQQYVVPMMHARHAQSEVWSLVVVGGDGREAGGWLATVERRSPSRTRLVPQAPSRTRLVPQAGPGAPVQAYGAGRMLSPVCGCQWLKERLVMHV